MPSKDVHALHQTYENRYHAAFCNKLDELLSQPCDREMPVPVAYWIAHRTADQSVTFGRYDDPVVANAYLACMRDLSDEVDAVLAESLEQEKDVLETWADLDKAWQMLDATPRTARRQHATFAGVATTCMRAIGIQYASKFKAANISDEVFGKAQSDLRDHFNQAYDKKHLINYSGNPFPAIMTTLSEIMGERLQELIAIEKTLAQDLTVTAGASA